MRINLKSRTAIKAIFIVMSLFTYCILCALLQNISWYYALTFLLYELFGIISVGFAIRNIIKLESVNWIETFGLSYALGYSANILLYIISFTLLGSLGFKILFSIVILASIIYNFRYIKLHKTVFQSCVDGKYIGIIFIFILFFQFFTFAASNCSTSYLGTNSYYVDLVHWASNAVTFTKQFPPVNFRVIDEGIYYYHYFSAIQVAEASIMTGIPVFNFVMGFSYIQSAIFLTFGSYIFFHYLVDNRFFLYVSIIMLLFTTGIEYYSWITMTAHLYTAPFGFDIGLILGMLTIVIFFKQMKEEKLNKSYLISTLTLFSICAGVKAPIACIVLVILGCNCFYLLFSKKKSRILIALIYGIAFVCLFIAIFVLFTNGIPNGSSTSEGFINDGTNNSILNRPEVAMVHDILIHHFSLLGGQLLFLIYYILLANPAIYLCGLLGGLIHLCEVKKIKCVDTAFVIGGITGMLLTRGLKLIGFSQIYFIMASFPYIIVFGIRGFVNYYNSRKEEHCNILWQCGIKAVTICILIIGINLFLNSMYFLPQITSGYKKVLNILGINSTMDIYLDASSGSIKCKEIENETRRNNGYLVVDNDDVNAAKWIKYNTDKDCKIISNLMDTASYQYNYMIGVIAERWIWMGDEELIYNAINGNINARDALREKGIQYMVLDKEKTSEIGNEQIVYSNDTVFIIALFHP